jgi:hypothetical protein
MAVAIAAGTVFASGAFAQKVARPAAPAPAPKHHQVAGRVLAQNANVTFPDRIRRVRLVNGQVMPLSEWTTYQPRVQVRDDVQYVFDAIQDNPGVLPGTLPTSNRYLLGFTTGLFDYTASYRAKDMAGIPAAAQGQGAKYCDFLHYEQNAATPLWVTIVTTEDFFPDVAPDATWNPYDGIQLEWTTGVGAGFWFTPVDVTLDPPPVGDGWKMPVDGSGAYVFIATRDAAGTIPAQGWQTGLWGTSNNITPPPANPRVGTQANVEWADDSTPPQCGAASLATNIANGQLEVTCENYDFTFAVPAGVPGVLATAVGFGMDVATGPTCYANCDNSTAVPFLNVNDFICFQSKFAAGDTYANCDNSTSAPVLNVNDFICFQSNFAAGCSAP